MEYIRSVTPDGLEDLVDYFDSTYVSGTVRSVRPTTNGIGRLRFRRLPPLFPPNTWNVHDITLAGGDRTNNACEAWNNGFARLVGHDHPSVWNLIIALQRDAVQAMTDMQREALGQPPKKRLRKATVELQRRLESLCVARRDNAKSMAELLRAVAHTIRFT